MSVNQLRTHAAITVQRTTFPEAKLTFQENFNNIGRSNLLTLGSESGCDLTWKLLVFWKTGC